MSGIEQPASKEERRAQLLGVALGLFADKGYHATSISDIIESADVARGTFYNYFESKRHIFGTILDELFDSVTAVIFPISTGSGDNIQNQIRGNIANLCTALQDNLPMARLLLEQAVGLDDEANDQLRDFYRRVLERLRKAIRDGQAMGIVRDGDDSVLASCLLGMIKESLYQQVLGTQEAKIEVLVREIFDVATRGILAEPLP